ncbi:MAG TPA: hypothetical protein VK249_08400 [Anaerolineales bacterium]|nr:hypothetical protein [Anaerolineales bacterium]
MYGSPGEPGKRGFEDLDCYKLALEVMFEALYKLIRQTEPLNGFMAYVPRQRTGSQEYGDKSMHEDQAAYEILSGGED